MEKTEIVSVCQDILHNTRKGHALKPERAFLVMAIRNVPGITDLVTILNGFDHTLYSSRLNFRRSKQLLSSLSDRLFSQK